MKFFLTIALFVIFSKTIESCSDHNDCPFGRCDTDAGQCRCDLPCRHFPKHLNSNFACSNETIIFLCFELSEVCEAQQNTAIRRLPPMYNDNCEVLFQEESTMELEFCENQHYCNFNGICLQNVHSERQECMCNEFYTGERCQNFIVPSLLERIITVSTRSPSAALRSSRNRDSMNIASHVIPIVAVIACLSIFICMFLICRGKSGLATSICRKKQSAEGKEAKPRKQSKDDEILTDAIMLRSDVRRIDE